MVCQSENVNTANLWQCLNMHIAIYLVLEEVVTTNPETTPWLGESVFPSA